MSVKIIGIKEQPNSKDATKIGTTIYYMQDFDDYSVQNASKIEGMMVGSDFTYDRLNCHVGDEAELLYRKGFQNQATLCGVNVVKPSAK